MDHVAVEVGALVVFALLCTFQAGRIVARLETLEDSVGELRILVRGVPGVPK